MSAPPTLDDLKHAVEHFQATYRHPVLSPLGVSDLYGLDPTAAPAGPATVATWPAPWLHGGEPGIYVILMADFRVHYVGRADALRERLDVHFRGRMTGAPRPRVTDPATWPEERRRYVVVIPVREAFETLSLEAYLIRHLRPPANYAGRGLTPVPSSSSPQQDAVEDELEP